MLRPRLLRNPAAPIGRDAAGFRATAISRLKDGWFEQRTAWLKRTYRLSAVSIWASGILQARLEDAKQRIVAPIGAMPERRMELVGFPIAKRAVAGAPASKVGGN